ncbi:MAG: hypothetical protein EOM51_10290 [Clostridia bacterium]|nr:hypothetical protein [Clostridia bacterium]
MLKDKADGEEEEVVSPDDILEPIDLDGDDQTDEDKPSKEPEKKPTPKDVSARINEVKRKADEKIAAAEREREEYKAKLERLETLVKTTKGYSGDDVEDQIRAEAYGLDIKDYKKLKDELIKPEPKKEAEKQDNSFEYQKAADFAKIADVYDVEASNMDELLKELGPEFAQKLAEGMNPVKAYKETVEDDKVKKTADVVKSSTISNIKSKDHMQPSKGGGGKGADLPQHYISDGEALGLSRENIIKAWQEEQKSKK